MKESWRTHIIEIIVKHIRETGCELKTLTYAKQGKDIEITLHLTEGE